MVLKTSVSSPLRIEPVQPGASTGLIGMTLCPGKTDPHAQGGPCKRDLNLDLDVVVRWGATAVVSLMTDGEFLDLKIPTSAFTEGLESRGLRWFHLPITDGEAPDDKFRRNWEVDSGREIKAILDQGHNVVIHCRGGLGRTGTLAAQLLWEYGSTKEDAISRVRQSRPGAIETKVQLDYIRSLDAIPAIPAIPDPVPEIPEEMVLDRIRGCLLGGATGDALGTTVEFSSAESNLSSQPGGISDFQMVYGKVGAISDDTQMTLFTAEACLRTRHRYLVKGLAGLEAVTIYAYARWLRTQSETPSKAHRDLESLTSPSFAYESYLMDTPEMNSRRSPGKTCIRATREGNPVLESQGCGGVMRVAPVGLTGFLMGWDDQTTWDSGSDIAGITHGHANGKDPAGYLSLLIAKLVSGGDLRDVVKRIQHLIDNYDENGTRPIKWNPDTRHLIHKAMELASLDPEFKLENLQTLGLGWNGHEAIAIAVYCALTAHSFESGVVNAANHSGNSATTASITGQILGVIHGSGSIPPQWLNRLELRNTIDLLARDMAIMYQPGQSDLHMAREESVLEARYPPN